MIKFFEIILTSAGGGFLLGWLARQFTVRTSKGTCRFIEQGTHGAMIACPGTNSMVCIDSLCPVHCNTLHGSKCSSVFNEDSNNKKDK